MPTPTYTALANITLGSSAASVTFSSISQAYRDLVLIQSATGSAATYSFIQVNGNTSTSYYGIDMGGNGVNPGSSSTGAVNALLSSWYYGNNVYTNPNIITWNFMDYSATDKQKTVIVRTNLQEYGVSAMVNRWANIAAITSMVITPGSGTWAAGSTFSLYGIAA